MASEDRISARAPEPSDTFSAADVEFIRGLIAAGRGARTAARHQSSCPPAELDELDMLDESKYTLEAALGESTRRLVTPGSSTRAERGAW